MHKIALQFQTRSSLFPESVRIQSYALEALRAYPGVAEVTLRMVDTAEMSMLNQTYRGKKGPTNVLSFPLYIPEPLAENEALPLLGDIVICVDVVIKEAEIQQKTVDAHVAHMVVHGILHLLGLDHEMATDAAIMEAQESELLCRLGFSDPYACQALSGK